MGSSASSDLKSHSLCPQCFDVEEAVDRRAQPAVHYRPSSVGAWLAHWEIEAVGDLLHDFGLRELTHASKLTPSHTLAVEKALGPDSEEKKKWTAAMCHVRHLQETSAYDALGSSSLSLWLESWRLGRLRGEFFDVLKCKNRDEVLAVGPRDIEAIGMRPLELRRWLRAQRLLRCGIQEEDGMRASFPNLDTWLQTFELSRFVDVFREVRHPLLTVTDQHL